MDSWSGVIEITILGVIIVVVESALNLIIIKFKIRLNQKMKWIILGVVLHSSSSEPSLQSKIESHFLFASIHISSHLNWFSRQSAFQRKKKKYYFENYTTKTRKKNELPELVIKGTSSVVVSWNENVVSSMSPLPESESIVDINMFALFVIVSIFVVVKSFEFVSKIKLETVVSSLLINDDVSAFEIVVSSKFNIDENDVAISMSSSSCCLDEKLIVSFTYDSKVVSLFSFIWVDSCKIWVVFSSFVEIIVSSLKVVSTFSLVIRPSEFSSVLEKTEDKLLSSVIVILFKLSISDSDVGWVSSFCCSVLSKLFSSYFI